MDHYCAASVNIMIHGLINPCIHLMESHQLYIIPFLTRRRLKVGVCIDIPASELLLKTLVPRPLNALHVSDVNKVFSFRYHPLHVSELNDLYFYSTSCLMCFSLEYHYFHFAFLFFLLCFLNYKWDKFIWRDIILIKMIHFTCVLLLRDLAR